MYRGMLTMTGGMVLGCALFASAQQPAPVAPPPAAVASVTPPVRATAARVLPGTRPNVFTTIQGNTLNSVNGSLPNVTVRLRDARIGRIVDTQLTDKAGLFTFRDVDPGSYIVEVIAADQSSILAASQLLNVNAGDAISAVVKLPFRIPPFAGLLGNTAQSAAAVTAQAAASGVLAISATQSTSETEPGRLTQ
jgi:hypothetical protein